MKILLAAVLFTQIKAGPLNTGSPNKDESLITELFKDEALITELLDTGLFNDGLPLNTALLFKRIKNNLKDIEADQPLISGLLKDEPIINELLNAGLLNGEPLNTVLALKIIKNKFEDTEARNGLLKLSKSALGMSNSMVKYKEHIENLYTQMNLLAIYSGIAIGLSVVAFFGVCFFVTRL